MHFFWILAACQGYIKIIFKTQECTLLNINFDTNGIFLPCNWAQIMWCGLVIIFYVWFLELLVEYARMEKL